MPVTSDNTLSEYLEPVVYPTALRTPTVLCPACGGPAAGFVGTRAASGGAEDAGAMPELGASTHHHRQYSDWIVFPCFCCVSQVWAKGLHREMRRRAAGAPSRAVSHMASSPQEMTQALLWMILQAYGRHVTAEYIGMVTASEGCVRELLPILTEFRRSRLEDKPELPEMSLVLSFRLRAWAATNRLFIPPHIMREDVEGSAVTREQLRGLIRSLSVYGAMTVAYTQQLADNVFAELEQSVTSKQPLRAATLQMLSRVAPKLFGTLSMVARHQPGFSLAEVEKPRRAVDRHIDFDVEEPEEAASEGADATDDPDEDDGEPDAGDVGDDAGDAA